MRNTILDVNWPTGHEQNLYVILAHVDHILFEGMIRDGRVDSVSVLSTSITSAVDHHLAKEGYESTERNRLDYLRSACYMAGVIWLSASLSDTEQRFVLQQ